MARLTRRPPSRATGSVLVRGSRIGELTLEELTEVVQDAWLSRSSARRARQWLGSR